MFIQTSEAQQARIEQAVQKEQKLKRWLNIEFTLCLLDVQIDNCLLTHLPDLPVCQCCVHQCSIIEHHTSMYNTLNAQDKKT